MVVVDSEGDIMRKREIERGMKEAGRDAGSASSDIDSLCI